MFAMQMDAVRETQNQNPNNLNNPNGNQGSQGTDSNGGESGTQGGSGSGNDGKIAKLLHCLRIALNLHPAEQKKIDLNLIKISKYSEAIGFLLIDRIPAISQRSVNGEMEFCKYPKQFEVF